MLYHDNHRWEIGRESREHPAQGRQAASRGSQGNNVKGGT
jgi:hypothetical protein